MQTKIDLGRFRRRFEEEIDGFTAGVSSCCKTAFRK